MTMPKQHQVVPVLLLILHHSGDGLRTAEAVQRAAAAFPQLTSEDLDAVVSSGGNHWDNRVRFARNELRKRGYLAQTQRGWWALNDAGHRAAAEIFP